MTHLPVRIVPDGGGSRELHGDELADWHARRERFERFKVSFVGPGAGMRPLRQREPGDDDE